ncbi:MAG: hypothetical protein AAF217_05015 [Pseudomonadota bacterium]
MALLQQLKRMRRETLSRLNNNPDFRLWSSLGSMIDELEELARDTRLNGPVSSSITGNQIAADSAIDKNIDSFNTPPCGGSPPTLFELPPVSNSHLRN